MLNATYYFSMKRIQKIFFSLRSKNQVSWIAFLMIRIENKKKKGHQCDLWIRSSPYINPLLSFVNALLSF